MAGTRARVDARASTDGRAWTHSHSRGIRVTRRANVILNDASGARARVGWARARAWVMVWGVVVRDRARKGACGGGRARALARARRSVPSGTTRREISRVCVCASRVAYGVGSRAGGGGGDGGYVSSRVRVANARDRASRRAWERGMGD